MDLLKYGLENEKSHCTVKKTLAKAALAVEKKRADWCEARLEKKVTLPEEDGTELLRKIREDIEKPE